MFLYIAGLVVLGLLGLGLCTVMFSSMLTRSEGQ